MTSSAHIPLRALSLAVTLAFASAWPARAQMVTGAAMEDFSKSFGLSGKGWSVEQTACSLGANALWPGEEATFTFFVKPGQPYREPVKVDVIHYGTKGKPGDWWKPVVFKIADTSSSTVDVDLPAEGGFVTVTPRIGDAFGGYALILDLGERGRAFGATCVRVAAPEPGRVWLPTYAMDLGWPHEMSPVVFNVFKRLAQATIAGLDPVEIAARDLTEPVSARPKLRIRITNVLNRSVKGNLTVTVEGLTAEPAQHPVMLAGNETREVDFTITGGAVEAANNYKLLATFDAGQDGVKKHAELIHANVIARRTITTDASSAMA